MSSCKFTREELKSYLLTHQVLRFYTRIIENSGYSAYWDISGKLIFATDSYAQMFGFNFWEEMIGISFEQVTSDMLPRLQDKSLEVKEYALELISKNVSYRHMVETSEIPISAIVIHPFKNTYASPVLITHFPIFDQSGFNLLGCYALILDFKLFGITDYLYGYDNKSLEVPLKMTDNQQLPIPLSNRQHEILFLLSIGLSQREVAQVLSISRSTVATICTEILGPKFGIYDANLQSLIKRARKLNIHKSIPSSLFRPWVFLIDEEDEALLNSQLVEEQPPEVARFLERAEFKQNDFLKSYLKVFMANINRNLYSALWGADGKIICATNKYARKCGFTSWEEMVGISFEPEDLIKLPATLGVEEEKLSRLSEVFNACKTIREQIYKTRKSSYAVIMHPFPKIFNTPLLVRQIPILNPAGQVIATRTEIASFTTMVSLRDCMANIDSGELDIPSIIQHSEQLTIPLTNRQHEILFLLSLGMAQSEAAAILKVSRGTIVRTCADLCPRFGLSETSASALVAAARKIDLHKYIPSSLCRVWVIELNNNIDPID